MEKSAISSLIQKMRLGWNLGNTFDAPPGETAWHNPVTTPEMIKKIHSRGFETLRLPVSWHCHVDEDFNVDPAFMKRVREVVDYGYDDGMYVIVNIHHDDRMFQPTREALEGGKRYLTRIWEQVSEEFRDYGERLIFETMNEPRLLRHKYEWRMDFSEPVCLEAIECVNLYNQAALDSIRRISPDRLVMVPPCCAAARHAWIPQFRVPEDPSDRLMISIHSYDPEQLCLMPNPEATVFDKSGEEELERLMSRLDERFVQNGLPVVIGEAGIWDKNNPDERYRWAKFFTDCAKRHGMAAVWWDNGGREFKLFDRRACEFYPEHEGVVNGLLEGSSLE